MIEHTCPYCQASVTSVDHFAGFTVRCSSCGSNVQVPVATPRGLLRAGVDMVSRVTLPPARIVNPPTLAERARHWGAWLLAVSIPLALAGGLAALYFFRPSTVHSSTVHVDNASPHDLRVAVDNDDWTTSPSGSQTTAKLRCGSHRIVVKAAKDGRVLDEFTADVEEGSRYVLNLLGAQTYYYGHVIYGRPLLPFGQPDNPVQQSRDRWFAANVDFLFRNPPSKIRVKVMEGTAVFHTEDLTYLLREPPQLEEEKEE